jgi:EAL domain-containing protein (putative c-di-GMP-specific phosphodiesterase class I)
LPAIRDPQALAAILARDPALRERLAGWTLAQAILTAGRWLSAGTALSVAVELTHGQLGTPAFAESLEQKLADAKLTPELLELEITDMPDDDELAALAAVLVDVRATGVRIALARIDDRCSLGELRRLPLDTLRIDHSTIERLGPEFVATVSKVARALELRFAATGIDSPAALAAIDPHEPDELSGLLLGPAVPGTGVPGLCAPDAIAPNRTLHAPLGARSQ